MSLEKMEETVAVLMERPNGNGWAHLVSDQKGEGGRVELQIFLRKIGVRRPLHRAGTYAEHCDIRGAEITLARRAGADVITRRELALLLRKKKAGQRPAFSLASLAGDP